MVVENSKFAPVGSSSATKHLLDPPVGVGSTGLTMGKPASSSLPHDVDVPVPIQLDGSGKEYRVAAIGLAPPT